MGDEESGYASHNFAVANDSSVRGKMLLVRFLQALRHGEQGEKLLVHLLWVLLMLLILVSVFVDPIFFYISVINNDSNCLQSDNVLRIVVVVLRTFADGAYLTLWWCSSGLASRSRPQSPRKWTCFGVHIPGKVHFLIVGLAFLPLPQVVVYAMSWRLLTVELLKFIVLIQIVPRVYLTFQTHEYARNCFHGIMNLTFAAAFYFLMFTLAGNVLGAFWYLRAVERNMDCWKKACTIRGLCGVSSLYCHGNLSNNKYFDEFCPIPPTPDSTFFDYGIYLGAFQRNIMGMNTNFINKVFYCTWWGLLSLSSFGQNLDPGTYVWDNIFSTFIVVSGLILFALLIGNMQVHLQKKESSNADEQVPKKESSNADEQVPKKESSNADEQERMEWMEKEKQESMNRIGSAFVDWPLFGSLPLPLKVSILACKDEKWLRTIEINLQSLLNNTPVTLQNCIMEHLCKKLFSNVERFEMLPEIIKTNLRKRAKPVVFQARTIIRKEGHPICEMIHIAHGKALAFEKDSNMSKVNDPIGKELLDRCLESPEPFLPLATDTVMAVTTVEAFTLSLDDILSVFTRHGNLIETYKKEWAARAVTTALRKNRAMVMIGLQKDMLTGSRNGKMDSDHVTPDSSS